MHSDKPFEKADGTGLFMAYAECLQACLPFTAAALYKGSGDEAERVAAVGADHSDNSLPDDAAQGASKSGLRLAATLEGTDYTVVCHLSRAATESERKSFAAVIRLMAEGLAREAQAAQLARERDYIRQALETLPEAIAVFDEDERFVFWNTRFAETYDAGVPLKIGRRFEEHLVFCLEAGLVKNAIGREAEWLAERMTRFRLAEGAHEHPLTNGQWVRTQDRALPGGGRIGIRTDITDFIQREQSFRLLFDSNPTPMLIIDRESLGITAVNEASAAFYGYPAEQMTRMRLPDIRPEEVEGEIRGMIDRLDTAEIARKPRMHIGADGQQRLVRVNACFVDYQGRPCILSAIFDMTDRYRAEEEILKTRRFLRDVVDHVPLALFVKDMEDDGRYVLYNKAGETLFGYTHQEVIGFSDADLFGAEASAQYRTQDAKVLALGSLDMIEEQAGTRDQTHATSVRLRKVALTDSTSGKPRYVLGLGEDVTEQRKREAAISLLALHDPLTGLPNRRSFDAELSSGMASMTPEFLQAMFFIDLDGFKAVNDTFGHAAGDRLLQDVAQRLKSVIRPEDSVARFGGDEFAITARVRNQSEAEFMATRIVSSLSAPYQHQDREFNISASVGISCAPLHAETPPHLISRADSALYQAKRAGKNRFAVWEQEETDADGVKQP